MNTEENLRTTPSKGSRPGSSSSPSTRSSTKKGTKNAKITNFFTKVNSPLARNSSNSNADMADDSNGDASSSSMKAPSTNLDEPGKNGSAKNKDYVFIVPSSDDDTNLSQKNSQSAAVKRKRPPSVHSSTSKSSDGFVLTNTSNGELGIGRKKRVLDLMGGHARSDSSSNQDASLTPTRCPSRDSTLTPTNPTGNAQKINRIQPTMIGCRTKTVDFQSVPSDLNLPREQAEQLIQRLFLVRMPEDFHLFWEFAKTINHRKPCSAFSLAYLDWNLVGPYDVLSGLITDFHGFSKEDLLRHCRFYYDPPEFQTIIIKKDEHMTHYGYYRDEPSQSTSIVVANMAALNGDIHEAGDNLFTLLRSELESSIASLSKSSQEMPTFSSSSSNTPRSTKMQPEKQTQLEIAKAKQELTIIRDKLLDFCSSHENISTDSWQRTVARRARCITKTLNTIGVVLPKDENITLSDASRLSDDDVIDMIKNTAESRCSPGKMLELGHDLFYRGDLSNHDDIEKLLTIAYTRLGRAEFADIVKSHLGDRKTGGKVSLLD